MDQDYDIETNLLKDTKIVLHQVAVRPRACSSNAYLFGTVEEIELSWTWGGGSGSGSGNSSSFVRDTRLAIRGASFRVEIGGEQPPETVTSDDLSAAHSANAAPQKNDSDSKTKDTSQEGYVQRHLQEIMDHLTLDISDVTLVLDDKDIDQKYRLCVQAQGLQLVSLGRQEVSSEESQTTTASLSGTPPLPPTLSQRISLASMAAYLEPKIADERNTEARLPVLDPIGYAASVKRVAGRRFLDGWASGLEVVGEVLVSGRTRINSTKNQKTKEENSDGFVVHAGVEQVKAISELMSNIASSEGASSESNVDETTLGADLDQSREDFFYDCSSEASGGSVEPSDAPTTTITLPLPSITFVLPGDDINIHLPQCNFVYHVDGSICRMYGNQGIWIGSEQFIEFEKDAHSGWTVDWANHAVSLKGRQNEFSTQIVASVEWKDEVMKQVVESFAQIVSAAPRQIVDQVEMAMQEYSIQLPSEPCQNAGNDSSWSLETNGCVSFKATCVDEWVEATLGSISIEMSPQCSDDGFPLSRLHVSGANIGPTSFGKTRSSWIRIPGVDLIGEPNHSKICLAGPVDATVESRQVMQGLQKFLSNLLDFQGSESTPVSDSQMQQAMKQNYTLPVAEIPGIDLFVAEESMKLHLDKLFIAQPKSAMLQVGCDKIRGWFEYTGESDEDISMNGVNVEMHPLSGDATLTAQAIRTLTLPEVLDGLSEPINDISIRYLAGSGSLKFHSSSPIEVVVASDLLKGRMSPEGKDAPQQSSFILPISIDVDIPGIRLALPATKSAISIYPLKLTAAPWSEQRGTRGVNLELLGTSTEVRLDVNQPTKGSSWLKAYFDGRHKMSLRASLSSYYELDNITCNTIRVGPASSGNISVSIPALTMCTSLEKDKGAFEIQVQGRIKAIVPSQAVIEDMVAMVQYAADLSSLRNDGISASPSSSQDMSLWQDASVSIPEIEFTVEDKHSMRLQGTGILIKSYEVQVGSLQTIMDTSEYTIGSLAVDINLIKASMTPDFCEGHVTCSKISARGSHGIAAEVSQAAVKFSSSNLIQVKIPRIDTLYIPDAVEISEPILDSSVNFIDGMLKIDAPALIAVCPLLASSGPEKSTKCPMDPLSDLLKDEDHCAANVSIPFPVEMKVQKIKLRNKAVSNVALWVANLTLRAEPDGRSVSFKTYGDTMIRVVDSDNAWMQVAVAPITGAMTPNAGFSNPESLSCPFLNVGPCSFGKLQVHIPNIYLKDGKISTGEVSGSLESINIVTAIQMLWNQLFPPEPDAAIELPFAIQIPKVVLGVDEMGANAIAENIDIKGRSSNVVCDRFGFQQSNGLAATFSGLKATISPSIMLEVRFVDCFYIPEVFSIEKPVSSPTRLTFEGDKVCINVPPVDLIVFGGKAGESAPNGTTTKRSIEVPYAISLNFQHLSIKSFSQEGDITNIEQLAFHLSPQGKDPFAEADAPQKVPFHAVLSKAENKLMKLSKTHASGSIVGGDVSTIHYFKLSTGAADVAAGFSHVDWSNIFGKEKPREESAPVALPFCRLEPFLVHLQYRGKVVGFEKTAVSIHEFIGNEATDSKSLIQHLKRSVLDRAPAMLTNAQIFGQSVTEMAATSAGTAWMAASTMPVAAAGCVVGLAAQDSIRGAVAAGKQSRHATAGDKYQFGDFSRGVVHSVRNSTKAGGEGRRGSSDGYHFGDFSAGASKSVSSYASQNKSRLGSAGGSGAGMLLGCAVAGPIGLVAGSLIGSRAGRNVFQEGKKVPTDSGGPVHSQKAIAQQQTEATASAPLDEDLLGISHPNVGSTFSSSGTDTSMSQQTTVRQHHHGVGNSQYPEMTNDSADLLGLENDGMHTAPNQSSFVSAHTRTQPPQQHTTQQHGLPYRHQYQRPPVTPSPRVQPQAHMPQEQQQQGYRFGDLTKSVIAKGKAKSGRDKADGYKFGDFTRGLFR